MLIVSRPVRGAWIEITLQTRRTATAAASRPVRGAWIEMVNPTYTKTDGTMSRPVRGAWIEIKHVMRHTPADRVAPRKGRVD